MKTIKKMSSYSKTTFDRKIRNWQSSNWSTRSVQFARIPKRKTGKNASADCTETLSYVGDYGGAHSWQIPWRPPTFRFPEQRNRLFRPSCRLEVELWSSIRMLARLTIIGLADWKTRRGKVSRKNAWASAAKVSISDWTWKVEMKFEFYRRWMNCMF